MHTCIHLGYSVLCYVMCIVYCYPLPDHVPQRMMEKLGKTIGVSNTLSVHANRSSWSCFCGRWSGILCRCPNHWSLFSLSCSPIGSSPVSSNSYVNISLHVPQSHMRTHTHIHTRAHTHAQWSSVMHIMYVALSVKYIQWCSYIFLWRQAICNWWKRPFALLPVDRKSNYLNSFVMNKMMSLASSINRACWNRCQSQLAECFLASYSVSC